MAGEISKQDQALVRGAKMVSSARSDLTSELAGLRGQLSGIGTSWKGGGSVAFQGVMTRWDENSKKIISALEQFEANLVSSENTYDTNDQDQASTFGRLSGRLG